MRTNNTPKMIKYAQNRVWFINYSFEKVTKNIELNAELASLFTTELIDNPFINDGNKNLKITFTPEYLNRLNQALGKAAGYVSFYRIDALLNKNGFAYFTIECDFLKQNIDFQTVENTVTPAISVLFNDNFFNFEKILDSLFAQNILRKSKSYHFGVPQLLEQNELHSKFRSYLYNVHFVFVNDTEGFKTFQTENENQISVVKQSDAPAFTILDSNWFWSITQSEYESGKIAALIFPNFLALNESVVYSNAIFCYSGMLEIIVSEKSTIPSSLVRKVININNAKLINIKRLRPFLVSNQILHIEHHHSFNMDKKYSLYQASYDALITAVKALDTQISQKANRTVQFILLIFTGLTLYSVVNDIFIFLNTEKVGTGISIFKTSILLGISLLIAFMITRLKRLTDHI